MAREEHSEELVLVTGASGYLASHIVLKLLQDTVYRVRGSVRDVDSDKAESVNDIAKKLGKGAEDRLELVNADLLKADTWQSAVAGCTYVIHVASTVDNQKPVDEIINSARDGTLNVLEACKMAKSVKRVVITGSIAAVSADSAFDYNEERIYTEDDWTDPERAYGYNRGKTLAEKAAWEFITKLEGDECFGLVVILPALVTGPVLSSITTSTMALVQGLLSGKIPAVPKVNLPLIDVRDVADGHVRALTSDQVLGKRVIMASDPMWFSDIALLLQQEFASKGYRVSTWRVPSILMWFVGLFSTNVRRGMVPLLDKELKFDNRRMKELLGINSPIDVKKSVIDMAYSLIEFGQVKKMEG